MTAREPERTATAGEKAGHASDPAPAHAFTRPGQVAGRPAPDKCMTCGQPEAEHWLPTVAELAEAKAGRERAAYIDGLRQLAGALEAHPEARLPREGNGTGMLIQPRTAAEMDATAAALGCEWTPNVWSGDGIDFFEMNGGLAGLDIKLLIRREQVEDATDRLIDAARAHEATLAAQAGESNG